MTERDRNGGRKKKKQNNKFSVGLYTDLQEGSNTGDPRLIFEKIGHGWVKRWNVVMAEKFVEK